MESIQPQIAKFDKYLSQYKFLVNIEKNYSIPKVYLVISSTFLLALSIILDICAEFTVGLLSLVYPLFLSCKAIVKSDVKATKTWLLYFSIISLWSFMEFGGILSSIVPYYYILKSLVLVWLVAPNFMGINIVLDAVNPIISGYFMEKTEKE